MSTSSPKRNKTSGGKPVKKRSAKTSAKPRETETMSILKSIKRGIEKLLLRPVSSDNSPVSSDKKTEDPTVFTVKTDLPTDTDKMREMHRVLTEIKFLSTVGMTLKDSGGTLNRINVISSEVLNAVKP